MDLKIKLFLHTMESKTKDRIVDISKKFIMFFRSVSNKILDMVEYAVIRIISLFPTKETNE